jgi:RHH-type proline utilization regulon transcriptional repressor/proline dehydrogenase/delta 1-pyrroline-5-carboxylate dehydrogenase
MEWAMRDEQVKVELFRFVDVLPMLHTADSVCSHLFEYLGDGLEKAVAHLMAK